MSLSKITPPLVGSKQKTRSKLNSSAPWGKIRSNHTIPRNKEVIHPDNGSPLSPHSGIRVGPHKLICDWHGKLELYHIPDDPFEKHDISNKNPELTTKLHQQLKAWLTENVAPRYFPQRDESVAPKDATTPFPFRDLR